MGTPRKPNECKYSRETFYVRMEGSENKSALLFSPDPGGIYRVACGCGRAIRPTKIQAAPDPFERVVTMPMHYASPPPGPGKRHGSKVARLEDLPHVTAASLRALRDSAWIAYCGRRNPIEHLPSGLVAALARDLEEALEVLAKLTFAPVPGDDGAWLAYFEAMAKARKILDNANGKGW